MALYPMKSQKVQCQMYEARDRYIFRKIFPRVVPLIMKILDVRPAHGLDPRYYEDIIGKTAAKNLKAGDRLILENINEKIELKESHE